MYNLDKFPRQYLPERLCNVFGWAYDSQYRYGELGLAIRVINHKTCRAEWRTLSYARICSLFHWKRISFLDGIYVHVEQLSDEEMARFLCEHFNKDARARERGICSATTRAAA